MSSQFSYREFDVPPQLRAHVRAAWQMRVTGSSSHVETVYPDGCCEIIVHLGEPMFANGSGGQWFQQPRCLFVGQQTAAVRLAARSPAQCFGVRLQPAASTVLYPNRSTSLRDQIVDLLTVNKQFGRQFSALSPGEPQGLDALWGLLDQYIAKVKLDQRVEAALEMLSEHDGDLAIAEVVSALGVSERTFQALFLGAVDLNAKTYARILRVQALIRSLDQESAAVSHLAANRGYADQSHATRETRRITGQTPVALREAMRQDRAGESSLRMAAAFIRGE